MSALLDFMQEKWRFWFTLCDLNRDGVMTSADWDKGAEVMIQEHGFTGQEAELVKDNFKKLGATILGDGHLKGQISVEVDRLVANLTSFFLTNRAQAYEYIDDVVRQLFTICDVDCDNYISEREFIVMYKCMVIKEKHARALYESMANSETGLVPLRRAISWWVDMWMGADREKWQEVLLICSS